MRDLSDCPDGSASACRVVGGPTLRLNCAAGRFDRWHCLTARHSLEKRTRFEAAPAASIAGDVGRYGTGITDIKLLVIIIVFRFISHIIHFVPALCFKKVN